MRLKDKDEINETVEQDSLMFKNTENLQSVHWEDGLYDFRKNYDPNKINLFRVSLVQTQFASEAKKVGHVQMQISDLYDLKL